MKKAMLFCIALLFSVGANAASLNITTAGSINATQEVDLTNNSTVLAGGTVASASNDWESYFNVSTDVDTPVKIEWSFNPVSNLISATLGIWEIGGGFSQYFDITGDFSFTAFLMAGKTYGIDIYDASSNVLKYDLSVSAVPVPAALFLFAPALLAFFGLRRKAQAVAA